MSSARRERRALERSNRKSEEPSDSPSSSEVVAKSGSPVHSAARFLAGVILGVGIFAFITKMDTKQSVEFQPPPSVQETASRQPRLGQLLEMTDDQLASVDVALMNLLCTEGLPGGQKASTPECLSKLNELAEAVQRETVRNFHQFKENPGEFENSEQFFRVLLLNSVIGQDFGLRYNPEKIAAPSLAAFNDQSFYEEPDDVFLSGLLGEHRMGTCASMPVLCVAIGRKLGYPLKMVAAKGHLFFRWDDGKTRMNFESTNGIHSYPDSYYQQWPAPITDEEVQQGQYLRSLTPRQELAVFLSLRGQVFRFHRRTAEAVIANAQAHLLHPDLRVYQVGLALATREQLSQLAMHDPFQGLQEIPKGLPLHMSPQEDVERINAINEWNQMELQRRAQRALQPGLHGNRSPMTPSTGFPR